MFALPSHANQMRQENIEKIIENFLIKNPQLLRSVLDNYKKNTELEKKKKAIQSLKSFKNPGIFQKNADVTIYEFFDYNCGYCKSVVKTIIETISEDKKINVVFVEFPILSQQSYAAAVAALASKKQNLYNKFHLSLMKIRGKVDDKRVFKTAKEIGLDVQQLKIDMNDPDISNQLNKNREIAKLLNLNGTPAFIIGDVIYPGALSKENLKEIIKKVRES
jgi:protein-disulfide isomerase